MMMSAPFKYLEVKSHFDKKNAAETARRIHERPFQAEQERESRIRFLIR